MTGRVGRRGQKHEVGSGELCRIFNTNPMTVSRWRQAGMPARRDPGHKTGYLFCPADCIEWRLQRLRSELIERYEQAETEGDDDRTTQKEAARRKTLAEARMKELDLELKRGTIAPVERIEAVWSDAFASARTAFLDIPSKLAPELVPMDRVEDVDDRLHDEISGILDDLAARGGNATVDVAAPSPPAPEGE